MVTLLSVDSEGKLHFPILPSQHGFTNMDTTIVYDIRLYDLVTVRCMIFDKLYPNKLLRTW